MTIVANGISPKGKGAKSMRLAIAGAQHFHVNEILDSARSVPGLEIAGIADFDCTVRHKIAEKYGIPSFATLDELLHSVQPDMIGCFDIPSQRAEIIAACLDRGISVLSDKPAAVTEAQLDLIRRAANRAPGSYPGGFRPVFSVILSERYNPPVVTMKKVIESGAIGEIVNFTAFRPHKLRKASRPEWFFRRATYGGILVDMAIHDIDVFHWLTGSRPVEITAYSANHTCPEYPEFEDNGQMLFRAQNGTVGYIKVEWLTPEAHTAHGDCRFFITGTEGSLEVSTEGDLAAKGGKVTLCTHKAPSRNLPLESPSGTLLSDFVQAVADAQAGKNNGAGIFMEIPAGAALDATRAVLAAREAADSGCRVTLQWEEGE